MLASLVRLERGQLSFVKYIGITARSTRQCLKEEERVKSEKREALGLKYQTWSGGKAGEAKFFREPVAEDK